MKPTTSSVSRGVSLAAALKVTASGGFPFTQPIGIGGLRTVPAVLETVRES
jgi:hypothetical protein